MRAVGAKVAVGVTTASIFDNGTPDHFHDNCHWYRLPGLTLRYFYRKQAASRSSEQAHDARLALFLRFQRALTTWDLHIDVMAPILAISLGFIDAPTARAVHLAMARGIIPLFYLLALHLGISPTDVWRVFTNFVSDYKYL